MVPKVIKIKNEWTTTTTLLAFASVLCSTVKFMILSNNLEKHGSLAFAIFYSRLFSPYFSISLIFGIFLFFPYATCDVRVSSLPSIRVPLSLCLLSISTRSSTHHLCVMCDMMGSRQVNRQQRQHKLTPCVGDNKLYFIHMRIACHESDSTTNRF